jgi:hypothetical protein
VALAPIWLAFPCKGLIFGAIPQLVLLYKIDSQDKWLIQIWNDIAFVLNKFRIDAEIEFVETLNWQRLAPCTAKIWGFVHVKLLQPMMGWKVSKNFLAHARNVCSCVIKASNFECILYINP